MNWSLKRDGTPERAGWSISKTGLDSNITWYWRPHLSILVSTKIPIRSEQVWFGNSAPMAQQNYCITHNPLLHGKRLDYCFHASKWFIGMDDWHGPRWGEEWGLKDQLIYLFSFSMRLWQTSSSNTMKRGIAARPTTTKRGTSTHWMISAGCWLAGYGVMIQRAEKLTTGIDMVLLAIWYQLTNHTHIDARIHFIWIFSMSNTRR